MLHVQSVPLAPQPHVASHVHVGAQEQGDVQPQLELLLVVLASFVVVFMSHLVFGLAGFYGDTASES